MAGYVLGVSAYYHDSAAALVAGGDIVAAAQEERFSRRKHDSRFPKHAIDYCLGEAYVEPAALEAVVFYDNPLLAIDRVVKNAVTMAPAGRATFEKACRTIFGQKVHLLDDLTDTLGEPPRLLMTNHHHAHAASCFYPSSFDEAATLTIDGVGEWATCTLGFGRGTHLEILKELNYPHSLGFLYSAFTQYCGFEVNSGEYKLMGLASYGEPTYVRVIRDRLVHVLDDGSFRLETDHFGYLDDESMINGKFEQLFDGPPRRPGTPITRKEMNLAASIQAVTEDIVLKLVAHVVHLTGTRRLAMAGGVALNCVANGRILRESAVDELFVQPAAGDAGGALGAALLVSHQLFGAPRRVGHRRDSLKGSYLGPAFTGHEVAAFLERREAPHHHLPDPEERARLVSRALAEGAIVGLFTGRMEFGPRALGGRSILADPRRPDMQNALNLKTKHRESFRPFGCAVLAMHAPAYLELEHESPYMLLVAQVRDPGRSGASLEGPGGDPQGTLARHQSALPAVTHVDYSTRVQTVTMDGHPELHRILEAFYERTGCPVLVNTSFNVRDEPIVCTPQDAYRCFMSTDMDLLVLEDRVLWKTEQPVPAAEHPDPPGAARVPQDHQLGAELFDTIIVPLAHHRRTVDAQPYFPLSRREGTASYFEAPRVAVMTSEAFEFPGAGAVDGLLDGLAALWTGQHETTLAADGVPRMKAMARERLEPEDGIVSILCYTMF